MNKASKTGHPMTQIIYMATMCHFGLGSHRKLKIDFQSCGSCARYHNLPNELWIDLIYV